MAGADKPTDKDLAVVHKGEGYFQIEERLHQDWSRDELLNEAHKVKKLNGDRNVLKVGEEIKIADHHKTSVKRQHTSQKEKVLPAPEQVRQPVNEKKCIETKPPNPPEKRRESKPKGEGAQSTEIELGLHVLAKTETVEAKVVARTSNLNDSNAEHKAEAESKEALTDATKFSASAVDEFVKTGDLGALSKRVTESFGVEAKRYLGLNDENKPVFKVTFESNHLEHELNFDLPSKFALPAGVATSEYNFGVHKDFKIPTGSENIEMTAEVSKNPADFNQLTQLDLAAKKEEWLKDAGKFRDYVTSRASDWALHGINKDEASKSAKAIFGDSIECTFGFDAEHRPSVDITRASGAYQQELDVSFGGVEPGRKKNDNSPPPIILPPGPGKDNPPPPPNKNGGPPGGGGPGDNGGGPVTPPSPPGAPKQIDVNKPAASDAQTGAANDNTKKSSTSLLSELSQAQDAATKYGADFKQEAKNFYDQHGGATGAAIAGAGALLAGAALYKFHNRGAAKSIMRFFDRTAAREGEAINEISGVGAETKLIQGPEQTRLLTGPKEEFKLPEPANDNELPGPEPFGPPEPQGPPKPPGSPGSSGGEITPEVEGKGNMPANRSSDAKEEIRKELSAQMAQHAATAGASAAGLAAAGATAAEVGKAARAVTAAEKAAAIDEIRQQAREMSAAHSGLGVNPGIKMPGGPLPSVSADGSGSAGQLNFARGVAPQDVTTQAVNPTGLKNDVTLIRQDGGVAIASIKLDRQTNFPFSVHDLKVEGPAVTNVVASNPHAAFIPGAPARPGANSIGGMPHANLVAGTPRIDTSSTNFLTSALQPYKVKINKVTYDIFGKKFTVENPE